MVMGCIGRKNNFSILCPFYSLALSAVLIANAKKKVQSYLAV